MAEGVPTKTPDRTRSTGGRSIRMRVAVVSHLYPSDEAPGRGTFVEEQVLALPRGVDAVVLNARYDIPAPSTRRRSGVDIHDMPLPWRRGLPSAANMALVLPAYREGLSRAVRSLRVAPDLLHAHYGYPDGVAAVEVGRRLGIPVVVTLHGSDANRQMTRPGFGAAMARSLSRADAIVCVSAPIERLARSRIRSDATVSYVPNGFDGAVFHFSPKPSGASDLLFVGALKPVKDVETLLRAFAQAAPVVNGSLTIAGDGPQRRALQVLAGELGMDGRVRFLGAVPHERVADLLAVSRALVLPSRSEGMPIAVLESLATGTPVVATRVGALPDLIDSADRGILVDPGDVAAMADALATAERTHWNHERIARDAAAFTWDESAARLAAVYRAAVARHKAVAR